MILFFDTIKNFDIWHAKVNKHFGYPNIKTKTEKYTNAILNNKDNTVLCKVDIKLPIKFSEDIQKITEEKTIVIN